MLKKRQLFGWVTVVTCFLSSAAFAVTVTPTTVSLSSGSTASIQVTGVSGTLTVTNSSPTLVIVSQAGANTYKLSGVAAGSAVIKFKDSKSSTTVNVKISAPSAAVLSGRLLASNCFQCHGTNGTGGFEKLAGQSASEIYGELKKFASGAEDANGIMAAHAMGFTDAQLNAIAAYFSSVR